MHTVSLRAGHNPSETSASSKYAPKAVAVRPVQMQASDTKPINEGGFRTLEFWRRAGGIYLGFKAVQVQATVQRWQGLPEHDIQEKLWKPHFARSGQDMYNLCVDMRGFFLKAGQFLGARGDFVPLEICQQLCKLQDQVPPMPPAQVDALLLEELCVNTLSDVFEWIDLEKPLGSASIAQVHKAQLRQPDPSQIAHRPNVLLRLPITIGRAIVRVVRRDAAPSVAIGNTEHIVSFGQDGWSIANERGVSLLDLQTANRGVSLRDLQAGQVLRLPAACDVNPDSSVEGRRARTLAVVERAGTSKEGPKDGIVAVKVQYPNSLPLMNQDLRNIRGLAEFLSKTEIPFDLVSAVDELKKQVQFEFDFTREARVMDSVALALHDISGRVVVPRSIPGLVTRRMLIMEYVDGLPLNQLASRTAGMSELAKRTAKKRVLERTSEAYGRMILGTGLFQADGHPGNILVMKGGNVALLDYGQSKQLTDKDRLNFARLVIALHGGDANEISDQMWGMEIETEKRDASLRTEMAYGMFDTRGKVDPFDEDSPIKKSAITSFPKEMFFVMRVVQLLRGMSHGMEIEYSTVDQWEPWARAALAESRKNGNIAEAAPTAKYYGI